MIRIYLRAISGRPPYSKINRFVYSPHVYPYRNLKWSNVVCLCPQFTADIVRKLCTRPLTPTIMLAVSKYAIPCTTECHKRVSVKGLLNNYACVHLRFTSPSRLLAISVTNLCIWKPFWLSARILSKSKVLFMFLACISSRA